MGGKYHGDRFYSFTTPPLERQAFGSIDIDVRRIARPINCDHHRGGEGLCIRSSRNYLIILDGYKMVDRERERAEDRYICLRLFATRLSIIFITTKLTRAEDYILKDFSTSTCNVKIRQKPWMEEKG